MANAVVVLGLVLAVGGGLISISIHKIEEGEHQSVDPHNVWVVLV